MMVPSYLYESYQAFQPHGFVIHGVSRFKSLQLNDVT